MKEEYVRHRARHDAIDEFGREKPDPVPMAPPVGYQRQPTLTERIRDMVRSEHVRLAALQAGAETFEEADDFEVGEDFDPESPYEEVFDPVEEDVRFRLRQEEHAAKVNARLEQSKPKQQEVEDGNGRNVDKGRVADRDGSSRGSDKVGKGKSGSQQDADDGGGVSKAGRGAAKFDE